MRGAAIRSAPTSSRVVHLLTGTSLRPAVRALIAAAASLAVAATATAQAARAQWAGASAHSLGQVVPGDRTLLVTFGDRPDAATARERLRGVGTIHESVPQVGLWELRAARPATARADVLRRPAVRLAEWSLRQTSDALTDPPKPPPATLPLQVLPDPADPVYADAAVAWGMHRGTWSMGLAAYDRPTIAILDSGIALTHEEWRDGGVVVFPRSIVDGDDTPEDVSPIGHGTHVAGIAAAPANGVGVVGVAPASGSPADPGMSKVMPVQVSVADGTSTVGMTIRGIRWAVTHGAKVVNISSGGPNYVQAYQNVVNWAYRNGVLIVASVGNDGLTGNEVSFPAGYDHVVGVGALCDAKVSVAFGCVAPFTRAGFSNFNASVDMLAPGVNVPSSVPLSVTKNQVAPGYGLLSGTSMAAPFVAGAAALVFASHPGITPYQVTRILESTASRAAAGRARTNRDGWGVVNPLAAAQAPAPVDDLAEPNDDVQFLPRGLTLRPGRAPVRLSAWADANDDPYDTYPVFLRKGQRLKVTIDAPSARLGVFVFRPSTPSTGAALSNAQLAVKSLGQTRVTTPGRRVVVVTARETGRHFVTVTATFRGSPYTLKIQRL